MMPIEPDHYGVLELEPGSPMEDVKSQYRRLAKRYHPDLHGDDAGFQEKFRRVNAAYTFLSDAPRKAAYDAVLQAARRAGAPPLKAVRPPLKSAPPPTDHHAPVATTRYQERPRDDIRMTRSAWLGATAGAVVVLLVIGLSLDGSGLRRPMSVEVASPTPAGSASGSYTGNTPEDGAGPDANADPPAASPAVPPSPPATDAAPALRPHVSPGPPPFVSPMSPDIVGDVLKPPRATLANPAKTDPADALRRRLLARYHAVLPRTDQLLDRGYAVRATDRDTDNESRRVLREQLAADLADLSAARARLRPALAHLSRQDTREEVNQEARPLLTELSRLEDAGKPVRDDIKALAAAPGAAFTAPSSTTAFHLGPLAPARAASDRPPPNVPADPAPAMASVVAPSPKPPEKPDPSPTVKPKAQAGSGQEFIMWGK